MATRRRGREAALQLLYALEVTQTDVSAVLHTAWAQAMMAEETRGFTMALVQGVLVHRDEIDGLIQEWSAHWSLERIALVERSILRFAIYELLYMPDIPPNVTINEAIEVAKKYGSGEAAAFINGILDRIKHEVVQQP
jgi:N utilization substance protein B